MPCHRILAASGKPGGFSANGGVDTKLELLRIEQARRSLFDGDGQLDFDPTQAAEALKLADPKLARLIARIGPCRLQLETTPTINSGLVLENVDGFEDPTHKFIFRSVPHTLSLKTSTAPDSV